MKKIQKWDETCSKMKPSKVNYKTIYQQLFFLTLSLLLTTCKQYARKTKNNLVRVYLSQYYPTLLKGGAVCLKGMDLIGILPFFLSFCLLPYATRFSGKGAYAKRKEFAPGRLLLIQEVKTFRNGCLPAIVSIPHGLKSFQSQNIPKVHAQPPSHHFYLSKIALQDYFTNFNPKILMICQR